MRYAVEVQSIIIAEYLIFLGSLGWAMLHDNPLRSIQLLHQEMGMKLLDITIV